MEQNSIKGIPYGLTDYTRLARENYYYVDKTHFIPLIEQFASYLFLIRPRRFGKTYVQFRHDALLRKQLSETR